MTTEQATSFELRLRAMVVVAAHLHFQNPVLTGWRCWIQWIVHPNRRCAAMAAAERFELLATVQAAYAGVEGGAARAYVNVLEAKLRRAYMKEMGG